MDRFRFAGALAARNDAAHIHILSPNRSEQKSFKGVFDTAVRAACLLLTPGL